MTRGKRLAKLIEAGFDNSYIVSGDKIHIRCSQCDVCIIQGIPCHETGCYNKLKAKEIEL